VKLNLIKKRYSLILFIIVSILFSHLSADNIELESIEVNSDDEVNIKIQKMEFLIDAPMQTQLGVEEALNIAGANGDPIKALKSLAGVIGSNDSGELIIHGSKPRETLFRIDHLPVGYIFHLGGMHSVFAPESIQQLDAYLGGFDVSYGDTMGAVIDLTPKYPTGTGSGRVHIGLYDADFSYDAKITDDTSLFIGGRRSYFDLFADKILDELYKDDDDESRKLTFSLFPQFYDFQFILSAVKGNNLFSVESIISKDELKLFNTVTGDRDPVANGKIESERSFETVGFRWQYFGEEFNSNTLLYRLSNRFNLGLFEDDFSVNYRSENIGLYHKTVWDIKDHKPMVGFEFTDNRVPLKANSPLQPQDDNYDYLLTEAEVKKVDTTFKSQNYSLYAGDTYSFFDFQFRYGIRGWNSTFQNFGGGVDPRTTIIYNGIDSVSLSAGIGKYSQFPNPQTVIEGLGNPKIDDFEHSIHYTFGVETDLSDGSSIKIEPYYKTFENLAIEDNLNGFEAVGKGDAYGLDLTYRKSINSFNFVLAYTYLQADRQLNSSNSKKYRFYAEIPHTLQFNGDYKFNSGWRVAGLFRYSSGSPYTKIVDREEYQYKGKTYIKPIYGEPFKESLPYTLDLDLQVGKSWKQWNGEVEFYVELLNLTTLFRDNVESIKYDDNYEKDGYYYGMLFTPAIHFSYRF